MRKLYLIFFVLLGSSTLCLAAGEYKIEKVLHNGDYIINGLHWKPQEHCAVLRKGDKIKFLNHKANGKCVSTTVLHESSNSSCDLWCEDHRSDG